MIDLDLDIIESVAQVLESLFSPQMVEAILDDLASAARAKWIRLAQMSLHATQRAYVDGIQEIEAKPGERVITLLGVLPNALEQGMGEFDLRDTLLRSPKAKVSTSLGKKYLAVPFRHATPGGQARQAGMPMGERMGPQGSQSRAWAAGGIMSSAEAKDLGKAIYDRAKRMKNRASSQKGERRLPAGLAPILAPWHKTDIYAGMIKQRAHPTAGGSTYTTFRTISEANPQGWIHPGLEPRHFADQVHDYLEDLVPKVIRSSLAGLEVG